MKLKAYLSSLSAKQKWKYGVLAAAAVLLTAAVIALIPWFMKVASPENMERITRWLKGIEPFGFIILFAVQLLQIVIAVIPGEPVELLAGFMYGPWGGLLFCLAGSAFGCMLVFFARAPFWKEADSKNVRQRKGSKAAFYENGEKQRIFAVYSVLYSRNAEGCAYLSFSAFGNFTAAFFDHYNDCKDPVHYYFDLCGEFSG